MHRGSSKGSSGAAAPPEHLPLSASTPPASVRVAVELRQGSGARHLQLDLPQGTTVTDLLKQIGQPREGSAVWIDDSPVPLDAPLLASARVLVVPTFSGG